MNIRVVRGGRQTASSTSISGKRKINNSPRNAERVYTPLTHSGASLTHDGLRIADFAAENLTHDIGVAPVRSMFLRAKHRKGLK